MHIRDFFYKFALTIRCALNWKLLLTYRPRIEKYGCSLPAAADKIWTPWYTDESGRPREFYHNDAMPNSVIHAASNSELLEYHEVQNRLMGQNTNFVFPGYKPPGPDILLLDGNHRSVSAMVEGRKISIALYIIKGPLDPSVLPDLHLWQ
ncbi:hypothetical protein [Desulfonatronovibrio magnus]|uniref:hypothetical protein n=1 Tax=Desulfonatronovibrio magnus TaxID=698827 RepID=UPI0012FBB71D|nr:hypothetical protein [Desulfonatronovibrio magnus]